MNQPADKAVVPDAASGPAAGWLARADELANRCVHCGFCNAVCPTYLLTGDEREGPRGRIHQVRMLAEGMAKAAEVGPQLDHCLGCRACESVCPSGVPYHHIAEFGRRAVAEAGVRGSADRWLRLVLVLVLLNRRLFGLLVALQRLTRGLLPRALARKVPPLRRFSPPRGKTLSTEQSGADELTASGEPRADRPRLRVALLEGCVQPALLPAIDAAFEAFIEQAGGRVVRVRGMGCCGALPQHLDEHARARRIIEGQVLALEQAVSEGATHITVTATGCAAFLLDWPTLLQEAPALQARASALVARFADPLELLLALPEGSFEARVPGRRVALQAPCSLQHAGVGSEALEALLRRAGITLVTAGAGPCCGSAGAYSVLFPQTANALREQRLDRLLASGADCIASANVGCIAHLQAGTDIPVLHWLELLAPAGAGGAKASGPEAGPMVSV